jgi:uncharacterized protein (TIGR03437 family)
VAWNDGEFRAQTGTADGDAVAAGQWTAGLFLNTAQIANNSGEKFRVVLPGTSIGRDQNSTDTNLPQDFDGHGGRAAIDVTPGQENTGRYNLVSTQASGSITPKPWTVMIYMDADNNLERYSFPNLKEIESVGGADNNVNVVVMVDGQTILQQATVDASGNPAPISGTLGGTWRFQLGPARDTFCNKDTLAGCFTTMLHWPGQDPFVGEQDMGNPATLTGFINWATTNYPAQKYALILWSHGNGWKYIGYDETVPGGQPGEGPINFLHMGQISTALTGHSFELMGFDACLMGTIEVAYQVQPFARFAVGSEALIRAEGWPYHLWLRGLKNNPTWNGGDLGKEIVRQFGLYYSDPSSPPDPDHTLAAVDETQLPSLVQSVSSLATALQVAASDFRTHDTPDDNIQQRILLAAFAERFVAPYIDLHDFVNRINRDSFIPACYKTQISSVLAASARFGPVVIGETHGPSHPGANGLSISMPLLRTCKGDAGLAGCVDFGESYDQPLSSFVGNVNSQFAMYARNNDKLPLQALDIKLGTPLQAPEQWPLVPMPGLRFPADTQWSQFLMRFYHPVADNRIVGAVNPDGSVVKPASVVPACGNPVDEITVVEGSRVSFSGAGSSALSQNTLVPVHWMWDFDHLTKGCTVCVAPYEVPDGVDAATANDDMNADHDASKTGTDHEKDADAIQVDHVFCQELRDYIVTLNVWDDNHLFKFHDTNPTARYVHPQTDSHTSTVHCAKVAPSIAINGVLNAADFTLRSVAPNTSLTVFGSNLACAPAPQVLMNGTSVDVLAATAAQINFVSPPQTNTAGAVSVQITCNGATSPIVTLQGAPAAPAIFTASQMGSGQGSILNQDLTVNSAASPAQQGATVMVFGTGFGAYNPPGPDGLKHLLLPVTAFVGEIPAMVIYAGEAPGQTPGVQQINVTLPVNAPTGASVPIRLVTNGVSTQAGVTVAVAVPVR